MLNKWLKILWKKNKNKRLPALAEHIWNADVEASCAWIAVYCQIFAMSAPIHYEIFYFNFWQIFYLQIPTPRWPRKCRENICLERESQPRRFHMWNWPKSGTSEVPNRRWLMGQQNLGMWSKNKRRTGWKEKIIF